MVYLDEYYRALGGPLVALAARRLGHRRCSFWFFWLWWWWLPKWQVNHLRFAVYDPKARADVEDNFRKTLTQLFAVLATLFAGIVALFAAGIAYLQLFSSSKRRLTSC